MTKTKSNKFWTFIGCVLFTLGVGTLSGFLSGAMRGYVGINTPDFAPPDWIFSVVWTVLYVMIGWSLYLAITYRPIDRTGEHIKNAFIILWFVQLVLNVLWPFIFFNVDYTVAFVIDALLVAAVTSLVTLGFFMRPLSSVMLLPYWGWLIFAAVENLMIIVLNA